jgi:hypothetical protein
LSDLTEVRWLHAETEGRVQARSLEARLEHPAETAAIAAACRDLNGASETPLELWLELPLLALPGAVQPTDAAVLAEALRPFFDTLKAAGVGGKVRTGSIEPELFPTPEALLTVLRLATEAEVPFKATAGLHHPLRGRYPLTYAEDAPLGWMFGYLNVLLATLALQAGMVEESARLLLLDNPKALRFEEDALVWEGHRFSLQAIQTLRSRGMTSFGSCSLREPVDELGGLLYPGATS